jgi:outer membrane immunogenic protein
LGAPAPVKELKHENIMGTETVLLILSIVLLSWWMQRRIVVAFLAMSFTTGIASAADWPVSAPPQFYGAGRLQAVEWTGLYFGVNAGYGWAKGSSNVIFTGPNGSPTTTPLGLGPTELGGTRVIGSGNFSGAIAGGQMGYNWQAGSVVFGAEVDAQWSGQQKTLSAICTFDCVATEAMKIKSIVTGRGRIGWAFDWFLPYVTAGAALVNRENDLILTAAGVTGIFKPLSSSTLGWTAGAGFEVALTSHWSARLEYLHIRTNDNATVAIPNVLGQGSALDDDARRDNILRVGLNYRFGPRGGSGVLETPLSPSPYALNYDFLPSGMVFADKTKPAKHPQATPNPAAAAAAPIAAAPIITADAAPETSSIAIPPKPAKQAFKTFAEIGALEDTDTIATEPGPPKSSLKKRREKEEDESQRLKRIMTICSGC